MIKISTTNKYETVLMLKLNPFIVKSAEQKFSFPSLWLITLEFCITLKIFTKFKK